MKWLLAPLLALSSLSLPLAAHIPDTNIGFTVGARADKVRVDLNALDAVAAPVVATYESKKLRTVQVGARGQLGLNQNWFLRGSVNYGVIGSGTTTINDLLDTTTTITGKDRGHTADWKLLLGYLFCFGNKFSLSPVAGWQWDLQEVRTHDTAIVGGAGVPYRKIKTSWSGPFVGVDLNYFFNCHWRVNGGVEFHVAEQRGSIAEPGTTVLVISEKSRGQFGGLIYLDGEYDFCNGWFLGLNLQALSFSGTNSGSVSPEAQAGAYSSASVKKAKWTSGQIDFMVGYRF